MSGTGTQNGVNGGSYAWPQASTVAVCIEGLDPDCIEDAVTVGVAPYLGRVATPSSGQRSRDFDAFYIARNLGMPARIRPFAESGQGARPDSAR